MPSPLVDVVESILVSPSRLAHTQVLLDQDDPYMIVQHSTIASSSSVTSGPQISPVSQLPASSADRPSSSRQLTLHQVLAQASTLQCLYRTTDRMLVRPRSLPIQLHAHSLLSSSPTSHLLLEMKLSDIYVNWSRQLECI